MINEILKIAAFIFSLQRGGKE
jgi:hypothetical protein